MFERNYTENSAIDQNNSFEIMGLVACLKEIIQRIMRSIEIIPLK